MHILSAIIWKDQFQTLFHVNLSLLSKYLKYWQGQPSPFPARLIWLYPNIHPSIHPANKVYFASNIMSQQFAVFDLYFRGNQHRWVLCVRAWRDGIKKEKKLVEFFTKVGWLGQQWTDFPLIFFFLKKNKSLNPLKLLKNHFKTNFFFSSIFGGGTLLSYDSSHMGGSNFKPVWESHLTTIRLSQ